MKVILALGKIAFDAVIAAPQFKAFGKKGIKFIHGSKYIFGDVIVVPSYHPSPRNVNTGKMDRKKFMNLLLEIKEMLK